MTTNAVIPTVPNDWVDLHAAAGISAGTALICQIKSVIKTNVIFVDAAVKPGALESAGGLETRGALKSVNSSPDIGEVTWVQARGSAIVNISVQDV